MTLELARDAVSFDVKDDHSAINLYYITVSYHPLQMRLMIVFKGIRTRPDAR